ncbi:MAG: hypothetical protein JST85_04950 [Acidobacteria bacterium]|nr:hypothetical protein [Acidobacteriota bacterium]
MPSFRFSSFARSIVFTLCLALFVSSVPQSASTQSAQIGSTPQPGVRTQGAPSPNLPNIDAVRNAVQPQINKPEPVRAKRCRHWDKKCKDLKEKKTSFLFPGNDGSAESLGPHRFQRAEESLGTHRFQRAETAGGALKRIGPLTESGALEAARTQTLDMIAAAKPQTFDWLNQALRFTSPLNWLKTSNRPVVDLPIGRRDSTARGSKRVGLNAALLAGPQC